MIQPIAVVMGQGQKPEGELLGLRQFFVDRGIPFNAFAHDEPILRERLAAGRFGGAVAHSFGGYELLQALPVMRPLAFVLVLDPKPKPWWQWWNPFYEFPLPTTLPPVLKCFYGGFGRPFVRQAFSEKLPIGHADFPGDARVQAWLAQTMHQTAGDGTRPNSPA